MSIVTACGLVLLAAVAAGASVPQEMPPREAPTVSLHLPPDVTADNVQISYFMAGSFGGYGGFLTIEKGQVLYEFPAAVNGKPAGSVKIIAFMPGCEIETLEIEMQGTSQARTLSCRALGWIPLRGRILTASAFHLPATKIEVNYEADWDHAFFGIADGLVTMLHIATVIPDENGRFEMELPDYLKQANLGTGAFQFILRNSTSGNIIAWLRPANMPRSVGGLAVLSSYAPFVVFSADTSAATPASADKGWEKDE